jgi:HAD superfamily hydrolase (TIGR01509 family)
LSDAGHRLAVATNGPKDLIRRALERTELVGYFHSIHSADDTGVGKPSPAVYLLACESLGVRPANAVAFEDSAVGAKAAYRAGLFVIGIPSTSEPLRADVIASRLDDQQILELLGLPT